MILKPLKFIKPNKPKIIVTVVLTFATLLTAISFTGYMWEDIPLWARVLFFPWILVSKISPESLSGFYSQIIVCLLIWYITVCILLSLVEVLRKKVPVEKKES